MYSQGITNLEPEEMIEFQNKIKSDIVTPVDMFTLPTDKKQIARSKLTETNKRIFTARQLTEKLVGPIQGGSGASSGRGGECRREQELVRFI